MMRYCFSAAALVGALFCLAVGQVLARGPAAARAETGGSTTLRAGMPNGRFPSYRLAVCRRECSFRGPTNESQREVEFVAGRPFGCQQVSGYATAAQSNRQATQPANYQAMFARQTTEAGAARAALAAKIASGNPRMTSRQAARAASAMIREYSRRADSDWRDARRDWGDSGYWYDDGFYGPAGYYDGGYGWPGGNWVTSRRLPRRAISASAPSRCKRT